MGVRIRIRNRNRFRGNGRNALVFSLLRFIPVLLILFLAPCLAAEPNNSLAEVPQAIRQVMESPRYKYARWGMMVKDLTREETLWSMNADTLIGPASVTKLFSAAAALDGLGSQFTLKTPVYASGKVDKSGLLKGDLILVAAGDLTLSDMRGLAAQVKASGIRTVKGEVVIDDRLFKRHRIYSVSRPGRLLYVLAPVMIHDNIVEFTIKPGRTPNSPATVTWQPQGPTLRVSVHVRTAGSAESEKLEIEADGTGRIIVTGQIPFQGQAVTKTAPVGDPSSLIRTSLISALKKAGVRVQALPAQGNSIARLPKPAMYDKTMQKVAEQVSPPLADTLRSILKTSHNQGADMLPLLLAVQSGRDTFEEGMKRERAFFVRTGIDPAALSLSDGSGISASNLVTPRAVVSLLSFMTTHKDFAAFRDGLPVLGVDGTLSNAVSAESPAKGKVLAKTGTIGLFDLMNNSGYVQIKALAGYMTAASGRKLAFAFFVNHVHPTDAPDSNAVLALTNNIGADLARIAEMIYMQN